MQITMKNGSTVINGTSYRGTNIQITGQRVIVDGIDQNADLGPVIDVQVHGDVESLDLEAGTVKAESVGTIKTVSGDVQCGNVSGPVSTVSGDVEAGAVSGPVSTVSGDVCHR